MENPLFTVVMATYNREDMLPRAVASVLNQTFADFELLVIDNGSTDGTESVVRDIKDGRVSYVRNNKPTSSCDGPRNLGITMAKGLYTAFLDDDDIWYPPRLGKVKSAFEEHPDVDAVCHYENRILRGSFDKVLAYGPWSENMYEKFLYKRNDLSPCATTIRTGVLRRLKGFDLNEEFVLVSDYELWLRLIRGGHKIHFIEEPLGEFLVTGKNVSIVNPVYDSKVALLIKKHILSYEKKPLFLVSRRGLSRLFWLYYFGGRSLMKGGKYREAFCFYAWATSFVAARPVLIYDVLRALILRSARDAIC